jgi:NAD(P)-dependent dehydrogenase (short-subunit alcohol dehydrogenase family)
MVIGANSGVGLATAKVLAANSKNFHIILATRSVEKGNAAMADIEATGIKGTLSTVQLDVTDDNSSRLFPFSKFLIG